MSKKKKKTEEVVEEYLGSLIYMDVVGFGLVVEKMGHDKYRVEWVEKSEVGRFFNFPWHRKDLKIARERVNRMRDRLCPDSSVGRASDL